MSPRPLAAAISGALLALVVAGPALAHAELVGSDPEDGAVLPAPPATVSVTFSEALDARKSRFQLVGPDGALGTGRVDADPAVLVLAGLSLAPGRYEVQWTAAAPDGHIERGKIRFTVAEATPAPRSPDPSPVPASSAPATAGSVTPPPPTPVPAASASASVSPGPAADGSAAASSGADVLVPIAVGLLLVAAVGVLVLRRSRQGRG